MRREFILILLGIIVVSSISSILSPLVDSISDKLENVLLDTVTGTVGAGNFSYWQLGHTGPLVVELTSITGDADLYIADNSKPSFEMDKNNFSSVTCGVDTVQVPADFPRPVGIGVFGHWSHLASDYSIQVFAEGGVLLTEAELQAWRTQEASAEASREKRRDWSSTEEEGPRFKMIIDYLLEKMMNRFAFP